MGLDFVRDQPQSNLNARSDIQNNTIEFQCALEANGRLQIEGEERKCAKTKRVNLTQIKASKRIN